MAELKIGRMVMGMCQTNCYFIYREGDPRVLVIDPPDQGEQIYRALVRNHFQVAAILLTHGHFDHILGVRGLKDAANEAAESEGGVAVKVYACETERELLGSTRLNASDQVGRPCRLYADVYVKDGEALTIADMSCRVIATPGHTEGGCCYYFEEAGFLISGDTLFQESIGRTDLPTGSMGALVRSVKDKLFDLPEETKVYPGHGDETTIGHEKRYNPFCR